MDNVNFQNMSKHRYVYIYMYTYAIIYFSLHRHPEGSAKAEGELLAQTKGATTKDLAVQTHEYIAK